MARKGYHIILLLLAILPMASYAQNRPTPNKSNHPKPPPAKPNPDRVLKPAITPVKTKSMGRNPDERTRILFLLDASGSMTQTWNDKTTETKWESAKRVLIELADSLSQYDNVEIALRVYGHQSLPTDHNCQDSKLEAGFSRSSMDYIRNKLKVIHPKGVTPIAYSLDKSAGDFPVAEGRNLIILMTDGEESCNGDPCKISAQLEKKGIVLKQFIIGFELDDVTKKLFDCMGTTYNVSDQVAFHDVMNTIMNRILNKTSVQVNLLDQAKKPVVTDANMTFYTARNEVYRYDYYHTMNENGLPDTLSIDPVTEYNLVVHTIPSVRKEKIALEPNKHNTITVPAAQGSLQVQLLGRTIDNNLNNRIKCLVRSAKDSNLIYMQELATTTRYLVGSYDLELLTLPRTYINVNIKEGKTSNIQIPTPGIANLVKKYEVYGGIFVMQNNKLEKIFELDEANAKSEVVALQPGNYFVIYRSKASKSMHTSQTVAFEIKSGESIAINLDVK